MMAAARRLGRHRPRAPPPRAGKCTVGPTPPLSSSSASNTDLHFPATARPLSKVLLAICVVSCGVLDGAASRWVLAVSTARPGSAAGPRPCWSKNRVSRWRSLCVGDEAWPSTAAGQVMWIEHARFLCSICGSPWAVSGGGRCRSWSSSADGEAMRTDHVRSVGRCARSAGGTNRPQNPRSPGASQCFGTSDRRQRRRPGAGPDGEQPPTLSKPCRDPWLVDSPAFLLGGLPGLDRCRRPQRPGYFHHGEVW